MRWSQLGFGRTSSTSRAQETPRNLMGFKDGTNNIKPRTTRRSTQHVWVGADGRAGVDGAAARTWSRGGSGCSSRSGTATTLRDQEQTIGRVKDSGAPLGGAHEFDEVDLAAKDADGLPVIADRRAHPPRRAGRERRASRILRRGYSFTDGIDPRLGQLDAGLFFIGFMSDPHVVRHAAGRGSAQNDALNEYIKHGGSARLRRPARQSPQGGFVGGQAPRLVA